MLQYEIEIQSETHMNKNIKYINVLIIKIKQVIKSCKQHPQKDYKCEMDQTAHFFKNPKLHAIGN